MDWLTGVPVASLSAPALLALVFLSVLAGRLVPRSALTDAREDCARRCADKDAQIRDWREAYRASEARGDVLAGQVDELVRQGRTTEHVLESLGQIIREEGRHDFPV